MTNSKINLGPLYIAFAAFLWATDVFVRGQFKDVLKSTHVVLFEHIIIVLAISPVFLKYAGELRSFNKNDWFALLFIGIGGSALATVFLTMGYFMGDYPYQYVAVVAFLQQFQPIVAIGLAHLLLKEKLPRYYYLFTLVAIIGVFMIFLPFMTNYSNKLSDLHLVFDAASNSTGLVAGLLGLLAAILWGASTVFGRYLLEHRETKLTYFQMTSYRFVVALIFLLIFSPLYDGLPAVGNLATGSVILALLYMALIPGLLSLISYYFGLKTTHASIATVFELTYPLSLFVLMPLLQVAFVAHIQIYGAIVLIFAATFISYLYAGDSRKAETAIIST